VRVRESGPRLAVSQEMQYLTRCNGLAHTWQCEIEKSAFGVVAVMGARICSSRSLFAEISDAAIVAVGNWTLCELECNTLTPGRSALPQTCLHACRLLHSHVLAAPPSMPPSQLHSDLQNPPNVFARGGMGGLRGHLWCQCVWSKCDRGSQGDYRGEHDQRVQVSSRANPPKYQIESSKISNADCQCTPRECSCFTNNGGGLPGGDTGSAGGAAGGAAANPPKRERSCSLTRDMSRQKP